MGRIDEIAAPTRGVLHPTDFSPAGEVAFAHALRIAVDTRAALYILHIKRDDDDDEPVPWNEYPSVRRTLQKWGHLSSRASRSDVARKLGIKVKKVVGYDKDVIKAIVNFVETNPIDVLVLSTDGARGLPRWLKRAIAVPVSQRAKVRTLFVPAGVRGCVSPSNGQLVLDQVLIPVDHHPHPEAALVRADRIVDNWGKHDSQVSLLYVGAERDFPEVDLFFDEDLPWERITRRGNTVDEIIAVANRKMANLIIMVTEGRQGFLDAFRGSTTEQVIRRSPCPVLTLPADS